MLVLPKWLFNQKPHPNPNPIRLEGLAKIKSSESAERKHLETINPENSDGNGQHLLILIVGLANADKSQFTEVNRELLSFGTELSLLTGIVLK